MVGVDVHYDSRALATRKGSLGRSVGTRSRATRQPSKDQAAANEIDVTVGWATKLQSKFRH